jgi:glucarate dehydratase
VKIANIQATPVNIPLEAPLWWTGGLAAMGEALVGKDPLDIAACERVCVPPWQIVQNTDDARVVKAFGAIEIALWDLRGKAWASRWRRFSAARRAMWSRSPNISASARAAR